MGLKELHDARLKKLLEDINRREKEAYDSLRESLSDLREVESFGKKIYRFLPEEWKINIGWCGWFTISADTKYNENNIPIKRDPEEFRQIVKHVERIAGKKMERRVSGQSSSNLEMYATCYYGKLYVKVQMYHPTCRVTYRTIEIPASTKKEPVVSPECLGLRERKKHGEATA